MTTLARKKSIIETVEEIETKNKIQNLNKQNDSSINDDEFLKLLEQHKITQLTNDDVLFKISKMLLQSKDLELSKWSQLVLHLNYNESMLKDVKYIIKYVSMIRVDSKGVTKIKTKSDRDDKDFNKIRKDVLNALNENENGVTFASFVKFVKIIKDKYKPSSKGNNLSIFEKNLKKAKELCNMNRSKKSLQQFAKTEQYNNLKALIADIEQSIK